MSGGISPEISVVVPSYNGASRLPILLSALAQQDFRGAWELVVCLDGSTDESLAVLDSWSGALPLHVLEGRIRTGVSRVLNRGYAATNGAVIVRCDDDLTPRPDFIRRHLEWHLDRADMAVIGPTLDVFPDTRYAHAYGREAARRAVEASRLTSTDRRWIHWAANNSIRRETWEKTDGFSEAMFSYGEDSEFGYRLHKLGLSFVIDMHLLAEHRGPALTVQRRARRAFVSGSSSRVRDAMHPESVMHSASVPVGGRQRLWAWLSRSLGRTMNSVEDADQLGRFTDAAVNHLPTGLSRKIIALVVESSALAGYEVGPFDLHAFLAQKGRDLAEEADQANSAG